MTVSKTVRPMLSDHCLSVLSVGDVAVLWPNSWMDQDASWYGDIVLDGDPAPPPERAQQPLPTFSPCLLWLNGRPSQLLLFCNNSLISDMQTFAFCLVCEACWRNINNEHIEHLVLIECRL